MAQGSLKARSIAFWCAAVCLLAPVAAHAEEFQRLDREMAPDPFSETGDDWTPPPPGVEPELAVPPDIQVYADEETETWMEFLQRRLRFGVGFDEEYNDNIQLQDNLKRDEWTTTLESVILFNDPRGALLYGFQYETNAFRHHHSDKNGLDHDFLGYFDVDPGGRLQFHGEYGIQTHHLLSFAADDVDILRTSTELQEIVNTAWRGKATYALNDTNNLVPQFAYTTLDDHTDSDTNTDRKQLSILADIDHDLTPTWILYGGYTFTDTALPKNHTKDTTSHGARAGLRHQLTDTEDLDVTLTLQETTFDSGESEVDLGMKGNWLYQAGPRTRLQLGYSDNRATSYATSRRRFRVRNHSVKVEYDLTSLVMLNASAAHNLQEAGSQETASGLAPIRSEKIKQYTLGLGALWQVTENGQVILDYTYARGTSRDTTNQKVALGFEISF